MVCAFTIGGHTQHGCIMQVQLAVVEAGLGGVTDATNVFDPANLACAVITAIDQDHLKALGEPKTHRNDVVYLCRLWLAHTIQAPGSTASDRSEVLVQS